MIEGILVGLIGGLELILHQVAVTEGTPEVAVGIVDLERATEVFDGLESWEEKRGRGGRGGGGEEGRRGGSVSV